MTFRENVIIEARKQKELRAQGKSIPNEYKKYARISGLGIFLACGIGDLIIILICWYTGTYYIFFILLFAVLSMIGLVQFLIGRQFLNNGK
ncbi:MAG: hypothetical protein UU40_C0003G0009 [Candidatus Uhrbacteria bacterium GW2011_GWD2_41_121]|uniref:Uncharacterized protein n=1 Tax=Candidatus Uhrbacteria bacterium GW2011_GWC1_41_20 TaxID=1618983 RepID=A0A0G0VFI8_9BACT|nr:MAG: hypothetical protein UT52_C0003G0009 [Candidatus Uhrbacteria bacterium GW2011_GWE1_39_46]KKR64269.1 MAG: hypothetical protein UU04_C0003G0009 [Candidatus Uhrbacteria bacterium GW2011_GWC2_40_450]KKR88272.1 MAG: hypothetical protein UU36_C0048G0011 [Candidatus Uhrbacteria bacterium GW2011_GWE2_41_1153]KKR90439.1 MAG: hypothetical protein UU40_C0003G0009 [Candidatus Uhrbacteria bacterium GW2011_GWD2_41_121]KKR96198.1 MAG: hypothetical protein UU46_C0006G0029 [Candidatus Uhrbacteria bacter